MAGDVVDHQAWGFWRITGDEKTFRWLDPETREPNQMFDIEVDVAKHDFDAVSDRLKRMIAREGEHFPHSETRIIESLKNARNDIVDGLTIWDSLKIK